jgi:hypothetical protein
VVSVEAGLHYVSMIALYDVLLGFPHHFGRCANLDPMPPLIHRFCIMAPVYLEAKDNSGED